MAPPLRRPWPATLPALLPCAGVLAFASAAGFAVAVLVPGSLPTLALVPAELSVRPWAALTYSFVYAGPVSLFLNLALLVLVAPRLESRVGGLRLAGYFAAGAVVGVLLALLEPTGTMVGGGPAVVGVLTGFARHCPDDALVPPLQWRGRWPAALVAAGVLAVGLPELVTASIRGLVIGGLAAALLVLARRPRRRAVERLVEAPNSHFNMPGVTLRDTSTPWDSLDLEALHEVNRAVVEQLLARARELGPSHLSPGERELLDRMASAHAIGSRGSGVVSRE